MSLDIKVQKLGYKDYKHYLRSSHWKDVKLRYLKSKLVKRDVSGLPKCEACERMDLKFNLHHRTYKRLGKEWLMDLSLLCELCHSEAHEYFKNNSVSLWTATKRVISIHKKELKKQAKKSTEIIYLEDKILDNRAKIAKINFGLSVGLVKKSSQ